MQPLAVGRAPRRVLVLDTKPLLGATVGAVGIAAALPLLVSHDTVTCPLRAATGIPCPFCGMTRGVGRVLHGDLPGALALNPGSVAMVLCVVMLAIAVAARRTSIRVAWWVPVLALASMWGFELAKYATARPL